MDHVTVATPAPDGAPPAEHRHPRLRPHRDDVLIALAGAVGGLFLWSLGLFNNVQQADRYGVHSLIPLAVMCLAVLGRRTAQPWAVLVGLLALVGDLFTASLLVTILLFSDLVYAAVMYGNARLSRAMVPASVALTLATTIGALAALGDPEAFLIGLVVSLVTTFPAGTGLLVRRHREEAAYERLRAEQTALLAEMDRTQAVNAERARMARELHDVVAGHLSAIAVHSTAAQTLDDHAATQRALGVIRDNSVQGLAEMRRLIELLRTTGGEDGEPAPVPTLAGLPALVERARGSGAEHGLRFVLDHERDGAAVAPRLPAPVELAAYRLVQESLTNALKHSGPGTVTVRLVRERTGAGTAPNGTAGGGAGTTAEALVVTVENPLGPDAAPRVPGTGTGLVGMRERVALLGGDFNAGPQQGSWLVRAVLPLDEGAGHR
ncbi:two-component sensor histidine kinase [Streptomyces sp. P38-E01]|uniref:histidine kinase n=1 Tax=Streptomyces tardus TaxID=2780544 RepID=A0A949JHH9_9ACTN|nr:histidine kinase [Streptomyces tardus]MBU7596364.1 two-component sensor histidine kinase [Streptomyces tardus]